MKYARQGLLAAGLAEGNLLPRLPYPFPPLPHTQTHTHTVLLAIVK